jgi:hypothetical protein
MPLIAFHGMLAVTPLSLTRGVSEDVCRTASAEASGASVATVGVAK